MFLYKRNYNLQFLSECLNISVVDAVQLKINEKWSNESLIFINFYNNKSMINNDTNDTNPIDC